MCKCTKRSCNLIIVAAWYVKTYVVYCLTSVTLSVGHAFNEINEVRQHISPRLSEWDEILLFDSQRLAVHYCRDWWTLTQAFPLGRENTEWRKNFVTLFSYIVWPNPMKFGTMRGIDAQQVGIFGELWSTFWEHKFSIADISDTFFVVGWRDMAWLEVWQWILVPRISRTFVLGFRDTMRRHASVLHWCTCYYSSVVK